MRLIAQHIGGNVRVADIKEKGVIIGRDVL